MEQAQHSLGVPTRTRSQRKLKRARPLLLLAALLAMEWAGGCGEAVNSSGLPNSRAAGAPSFTVAAAASLATAMDDALAAWNALGKGRGQSTYASSSTLARQIEQGAPIDLFVSANRAWMDHLAARDLIDADSRRAVARNALVLIQPQSAPERSIALPRGESPPRALTRRWSTGDPQHVPVGGYAREALVSLGWWEELRPQLVATADVRAALRLVERNEVDWGIVYHTDARMSRAVRVAAHLPADAHEPIVYPAALTTSDNPSARAFLDWLSGPQGRVLLAESGFQSSPSTAPAQP